MKEESYKTNSANIFGGFNVASSYIDSNHQPEGCWMNHDRPYFKCWLKSETPVFLDNTFDPNAYIKIEQQLPYDPIEKPEPLWFKVFTGKKQDGRHVVGFGRVSVGGDIEVDFPVPGGHLLDYSPGQGDHFYRKKKKKYEGMPRRERLGLPPLVKLSK